MRKTLLLILSALITVVAGAASRKPETSVKAPDFAYPKTVITDAKKVYDAAVRQGNEKAQLQAAIQIYLADMTIDKSSSDKSIKAFDKRVGKISSGSVKALAKLFEASAYRFALNQDRAKYSRRDLPLTPRPADLTEWSEAMFKAVIDSLANEAFLLSDRTPIEDFEGIVIADKLTRSFYPTVRDFVASYMTNSLSVNTDEEENVEFCKKMADFHPAHSYPWYAWKTLAISNNYSLDDDETKAYLNLYESQPQETGRAFTLSKILVQIEQVRKTREQQVAYVDSALNAFKGYWIENQILNVRNYLLRPSLSIGIQRDNVAANQEKLSLDIKYANIPSAKISVYNFKDKGKAVLAYKKGLGAYKPVQTYTLDFGKASPDLQDTTLCLTFPRGCNAVIGEMSNADYLLDDPIYINAYELSPVVISTSKHQVLYVLDASTGAPVKDVTVSAVSRGKKKKTTPLGKTDADGRLIFNASNNSYLTLTYNNFKCKYESIYLRDYGVPKNDRLKIELTTDLGIYKLGSEVRYAGFVSDSVGAVANYEISVSMCNAQYKIIDSQNVKSDNFGRFTGSFKLPEDARTGNFSLLASDKGDTFESCDFEVSDFKMPAFKGDSILVYGAGPNKNYLDVKGRIITYTDFPVSDAKVSVKVYGKDSTYTAQTNPKGRFELRIDSVFEKPDAELLAKGPFHEFYQYNSVTVNATSPDGTALEVYSGHPSRYPNKLSIKLEGDTSKDNVFCSDSPLMLTSTLKSPEGKELSGEILWRVYGRKDSVLMQGKGTTGETKLDLKALKPDSYTLKVTVADSLARPCSEYLTLYSLKSDSLPESDCQIWTPDKTMKLKNGKLTARILVAAPGATIFYGNHDSPEKYLHKYFGAGWQTLSIEEASVSSASVTAFCLRNIVTSSVAWETPEKEEKSGLKLTIESFRDKVYASDKENWTLKVTDNENHPVEAAVILNVYNSQLDFFSRPTLLTPSRPSFYIPAPSFDFPDTGWRSSFNISGKYKSLKTKNPLWPFWNTYNSSLFGNYVDYVTELFDSSAPIEELSDDIVVAYGTMKRSNRTGSVRTLAGAVSGIAVKESSDEEEYEQAVESPAAVPDTAMPESAELMEIRDSAAPDIFSALWMPSIVTDAQGLYNLTFDVPNVLTTWRVTATAWDRKMNSARFSKTISVSKPIMVSANMPRFLRAGDKATVLSSAMNNTSAPMTVHITGEILAGDSVLSSCSRELSIAPGAKEIISDNIDVPYSLAGQQLTYRVKASTDGYGDGEQIAVPVLDAESFVREAINFYLNPADSVYTTTLPGAKGRDFKSEFSFTANPMATIIDALPTLWCDPSPTAASLSTAYYGARIALSLTEKYPEIAAKFNRKNLEKFSVDALEKLIKLQRADGGWAWGEWSSESSPWITTIVLDRFYDLTRWGYLPDDSALSDALESAVEFFDDYVRGYDLFYAIVRPAFTMSKPSLNGQKVLDKTLNDITRNWKKYSTDEKALSVIALANNKRRATARSIIKSLDQFAVTSPAKGTQFRNESSLLAYGHLLEAYAAAAPESSIVDGLRQYLIVRRQATDWGNSLQTSYVVSSFLNSGTRWEAPVLAPTLTVDGSVVKLSKPDGKQMEYKAPVSGRQLRLERGGAEVPAYGSIVSSYVAPMSEIKAYSENDEIFIDKRLIVCDAAGQWHNAPARLTVGMKVRVSITIKTSRPMDYVSIVDERPAAFEPVEQLSRSIWQDRLFYYRENRDASTRIFIDHLPEGTNVISYDVTVNNAGTFASGLVTATCDKAPSLTAHSAGSTLTVLPAK